MPRVLLIATGDVIAYGPAGLLKAADLLDAAGPVAGDATPLDLLTEPAWDMTSSTMLTLADTVRAAVLDDGYDGVVVTQGLDTIDQTSPGCGAGSRRSR